MGLNVLAIVLAYLIGSIPVGMVFGKILGGIDVRDYGSGNIGTANVARSMGSRVAAAVLVLDMGKGVVAFFVGKSLGDAAYVEALAATAAVVGHNWSVLLRFTGGRGVSTGMGAMFAMAPVWAAASLGLGIVLIAIWRFVSLGSMAGAILGAMSLLVLALIGDRPWAYVGFGMATTAMILWQHRGNVGRLISGTERRLGQQVGPARARVRPP